MTTVNPLSQAAPQPAVLGGAAADQAARPAIRLVALDLDHTLVGPDLSLRPRVKEAVARVLARGVAATIVTGRGVGITSRYAAELGLTAPIICFQGGLVYDYRASRVLHEVRLDPAVVPIVTRLAEQHGWNLQFETTTMSYLPRVSAHPQALLDLLRLAGWQRVDNLATDLPEVPYKFILTVNDPAERDALAAELRARLAEAGLNLTVVPSHPILVEGLSGRADQGQGPGLVGQLSGPGARGGAGGRRQRQRCAHARMGRGRRGHGQRVAGGPSGRRLGRAERRR